MAWTTVETKIANPASKGAGRKTRRNVATKRKKLSAKQIMHFGTKRQRAALKAKRRRPAAKKRHAVAKKRNPARKVRRVVRRAPVRRKTSSARRKVRRSNPGEIVSLLLGNPSKRRKAVAKRRKKTTARRRTNPAGRRRKRAVTTRRHTRRRSNPGALGSPMDWVQGGAGVLAGGVGARLLPQIVLGASNAGPMGYAANAVAALGLGWLVHMLFPRNRVLSVATIAGGFAALLQRVISDNTSYGSILTGAGVGDYMVSSFATPQRIVDGLHSAELAVPGGSVVSVASAGAMNDTPGGGMSGSNLW